MAKMVQESRKPIERWWQSLDENRGDRAVLRRAMVPDDVLLTAAFARFLRQMPPGWPDSKVPITGAAMVAAVVAGVDKNIEESFAAALATDNNSKGRAVMSELRFQQLQKSRSPEEFFIRIRRAVNLLERKVNIVSLANDTLDWYQEHRFGPASRPEQRLAVRWANDYYINLKS